MRSRIFSRSDVSMMNLMWWRWAGFAVAAVNKKEGAISPLKLRSFFSPFLFLARSPAVACSCLFIPTCFFCYPCLPPWW